VAACDIREIEMKSALRPLILGLVTINVVSSAIAQPVRPECPQPVKIIVSYPPGSPDDVIARILAQKLSEAGGRFYVENLPGAGGMIGTATAARALPDGCTMVIVNQNFVVQPAIGEKLAYEVPDSFAPVTLLIAAPETISINPSVPANTLKELVALVKASPGTYNYASPGYGSSPHLASERLFKHTLGLVSGRDLDGCRSYPDSASHPSDRRPASARRQASVAGGSRQDAGCGISRRSHAGGGRHAEPRGRILGRDTGAEGNT
jgi:tripartite tricarboxylate transporter family receptor